MAPKKAASKRAGSFSKEEMEILLEGVQEHQALLFGGTRGPRDLKQKQDLWMVGYTVNYSLCLLICVFFLFLFCIDLYICSICL